MSIGSRVKRARKEAKLTQRELARIVGIKQSTISELERGQSRSSSHIALIARACNVSAEYLQGLTDTPTPGGSTQPAPGGGNVEIARYVPEITMEQAGKWTEVGVIHNVDEAMHWPCPVACGARTFALRVEGFSMLPRFTPGSIIFVDPDVNPESGSKVVAYLEDEGTTTFKEYHEDAGVRYLRATNPDWPKQYIEISEKCRIIGTVVFAGFMP